MSDWVCLDGCPLPPALQAHVDEWFKANAMTAKEVRHGTFPLGMVRGWIDRAEACEARLKAALEFLKG